MDKSIVFLTLALVCFFLVLSEFYGTKYISKFVAGIIPSAEE